jgi:hypothetical protein
MTLRLRHLVFKVTGISPERAGDEIVISLVSLLVMLVYSSTVSTGCWYKRLCAKALSTLHQRPKASNAELN